MTNYNASNERYATMQYNRCGKSGLMLPAVSFGLWHNFGTNDDYETMRQMCFTAFDSGITHFDLANNYGPLPGSAEANFGKILKEDLSSYRDEMIISTKAGKGVITFSPLAQGLLTDRYLNGIPADSRVARSGQFLRESDITDKRRSQILDCVKCINNTSFTKEELDQINTITEQ